VRKLIYTQIVFNLSWLIAITIALLLGQLSNISITKGATISAVLVLIYPFIMMRLSSKMKLSIDESSSFYLYPILIGFLLLATNIGGYMAAHTYIRVLNAQIIDLTSTSLSKQPLQSSQNAFYTINTLKKVNIFEKSKIVKTYDKNEGHANYNYVCYRVIPLFDSALSVEKINKKIMNASVNLWLTLKGSSLSPGCHIKDEENTGYVITIEKGKKSKIYEELVKERYQGKTPRVSPIFVQNSLTPQEEIRKHLYILLSVPVVTNIVSLLILLMLFLVYRNKSL